MIPTSLGWSIIRSYTWYKIGELYSDCLQKPHSVLCDGIKCRLDSQITTFWWNFKCSYKRALRDIGSSSQSGTRIQSGGRSTRSPESPVTLSASLISPVGYGVKKASIQHADHRDGLFLVRNRYLNSCRFLSPDATLSRPRQPSQSASPSHSPLQPTHSDLADVIALQAAHSAPSPGHPIPSTQLTRHPPPSAILAGLAYLIHPVVRTSLSQPYKTAHAAASRPLPGGYRFHFQEQNIHE